MRDYDRGPEKATGEESDNDQSDGEQGREREISATDDPHGRFRGQEMRPSTDRMGRARVEANAPGDEVPGPETGGRLSDSRLEGCLPEDMENSPAIAQETAVGRELEIERTRLRSMDDREERTRRVVTEMDLRRTKNGGIPLARRHPSVPLVRRTPDDGMALAEMRPDVPLDGLDEETQAEAAQAAAEMAADVDTRWSALEIQRRLGRRLRQGERLTHAILDVAKAARRHPPTGPCQEIDLGTLTEGVAYYRVRVEAEVQQLWTPRPGSGVHQVGLLTDETGATKLTVWKSAMQSGLTSTYSEPGFARKRTPAYRGRLQEGDRVRVTNAKVTTHNGRTNLEVDRYSTVGIVEATQRHGGDSGTADEAASSSPDRSAVTLPAAGSQVATDGRHTGDEQWAFPAGAACEWPEWHKD